MSDPIFKIEIKNPLDKQKIADVQGMLLAMAQAMAVENGLTLDYIADHYESLPWDSPWTMDGLRAPTGTLRKNNTASAPAIVGGNIQSTFGNVVEYAAIQEFGGQTKAHWIEARNAKALAFAPGGKFFSANDFNTALRGLRGKRRIEGTELFTAINGIIFRRRVWHPGSDIPARQPIQRGIEDRLPDYAKAMEAAAIKFANN
jgi:hypothetical protein